MKRKVFNLLIIILVTIFCLGACNRNYITALVMKL